MTADPERFTKASRSLIHAHIHTPINQSIRIIQNSLSLQPHLKSLFAANRQMGKVCVVFTFWMSSSSCSSSSLVMLYCCSSTSAKDSMARMDSLSFRVRTMSWNGERPTDQTLLEKHVHPCLLAADGQMGLTSQFSTGREYKLKWKATWQTSDDQLWAWAETRKEACVGGLKILQTAHKPVWSYETTNHSNASQVLKMLPSSLPLNAIA